MNRLCGFFLAVEKVVVFLGVNRELGRRLSGFLQTRSLVDP